jgi:hypothetical protein
LMRGRTLPHVAATHTPLYVYYQETQTRETNFETAPPEP